MHLPEDPVVCIVEQLDPRTVAGSRALFACMQSSTTLFSFAAPILWSAQVSLDIFKGLTVRCGTSSMMHIEVDTDALAQIERANVLGEEIRVGSLPWRWRNYLRSVRSITLHLAFSLGIRKVEMVASALGPHLPASFDAAQVSTGRGYGFLAEESVARQREWAEWLLNRPHGRAVRHVILEDMSPAEMEPFLQLRMKKLTWLRDRNARHDIVSALGKINDLEALVLGEPHGTYFDIYHTELYKITDVVKSFRAFRSLCLNTGCLPSKIDNGFQLKLTQFSYLMEDDDMETLGVILKASRSQMKEFRVLCGDLFQHTAFWGILSIMTSLTKIELLIPDLNITDLSSTILKLTNLQELYFCFDSVSGTLGDDVVCLPKLRHLKVKGNYEKPKNLRVNFGLGLKTISINNAVLVFDFESLSITGMPHLEELMLENDASVAPTAGFPLFDVCLAEMLEDAAASPALARVEGMTIQRLERHPELFVPSTDQNRKSASDANFLEPAQVMSPMVRSRSQLTSSMGSVANSPFNEAQLQRRLDLERKLDADLDELAKLQGSLMKSNALTEKMGSMLSSFDDRLSKLETSILPIHRSTQRLTVYHDNIAKTLDKVSLITDYFDLASKEETYISKGPSSDDLKPYIAVVSKMKEALHYLTTTRYRAAETAIAMLKLVLLKAQRHYDILFRRWLSQCSSPIDPTLHYLDPDSPPVVPPQKLMEDLHTIAQELGSLDMAPGEKGDVRDYVKAYADVRSAYLSRSLAPLATSAAALDLKKGAGYQRGMNPLCPLVRCFLRMIKTERELISKLIIKPQALACFHATISPAADALLEVGEQQVSRAKRNLARREHNDLYLLIDTAETLTACVRESDGMIAYAGSKGGEVVEMVAGMKAAAVGFFKGFLEDIQGDVQKSGLPTDGTVHEITSVTINIVRRLLDFESGVDMMLTYARTTASTLSPSTFPALVVDMLESLFATLDAKSKGYKKNTLAYIFLLNNYYYIHKQIKSMRTADFLPKELMTKYETAWVKQKDLYRESWKPCFDYLMDTTYVQAGGVKAMTKAQRDGVKDRFKNFNSEFDSTYSTQRVYTISDPELKAQVVKDIKGVLLPLYTRFLDRYRDSEFSKNPSKYIRYDKESLEAVLDRFFDGAA